MATNVICPGNLSPPFGLTQLVSLAFADGWPRLGNLALGTRPFSHLFAKDTAVTPGTAAAPQTAFNGFKLWELCRVKPLYGSAWRTFCTQSILGGSLTRVALVGKQP